MTAVILVGILYLCAVAVFVRNLPFFGCYDTDVFVSLTLFHTVTIYRPLSPSTTPPTYVARTSSSYLLQYNSLPSKYSSFPLLENGLENTAKPDAASIRAWAIIIAISCLGSLNSIVYTFSRGTNIPPKLH